MITLTLISLLAIWKYYLTAVLCIIVYRAWLKEQLNIYNKIAFSPILASFYVSDVLLNFTLLNLTFGMTPVGTKSMSERFEYYRRVKSPSPFALQVADFVCDKLLNTVDPTGNHC
jgi:hypothetical protein